VGSVSGTRLVARTILVSGALLATFGATPASGVDTTTLSGTITIAGTEGKDELVVDFDAAGGTMTVQPAATVTATAGSCPAKTDPLTGRPTINECAYDPQNLSLVVVDLKAGDDTVAVSHGRAVTVSGGAGNDRIQVDASDRTLRGDDGDDLLAAPGGMSTNQANNHAVAYDGGAGTDTASFVGAVASPGGDLVQIGVTASLETKTATFQGPTVSAPNGVYRVDTLTSIEGLSGTGVGDVLTGATKAETLVGETGNDNIRGGDGDDNIQGGGGLDDLVGGSGRDTLDGGPGIDTFPKGSGGDSFLARDGYAESIPCFSSDVIVDDLVDRVTGTPTSCSISTAAAKHHYDTKLSGRPARIVDGALQTRVRCPARKSTICKGDVEALLGRRTLGKAHYRVRPGDKLDLRLPLSKADARRAEGHKILLSATEVDADGRDRFVSRPTRVAKAAGRS
jgi:Ca2+-binding RTX toxin-like protein